MPQLTDEDDIHLGTQILGQCRSRDDTAARNSQHERIVQLAAFERWGKPVAAVFPILKYFRCHDRTPCQPANSRFATPFIHSNYFCIQRAATACRPSGQPGSFPYRPIGTESAAPSGSADSGAAPKP